MNNLSCDDARMDGNTQTNLIKDQIMEIISKFGFWMMTKEGLQGCAGYIHKPNRKIYIEIFFPPDYPKAPLKLNMTRDIRQHAALFDLLQQILPETVDLKIKPAELLGLIKTKIDALPATEIKEGLLDELDEELTLIKSIYNMKTVEGKKYHIRIFYQLTSKMNFEVEINFKQYPQKPEIVYHHNLEKIIGAPETLQILRTWKTTNPPHIVQIVQEIEQRFTSSQGIEDAAKLITVKNLTILNEKNQVVIQNLSFSALKGDIIGICCFNSEMILALFKAFLGAISPQEGTISIFGKIPDLQEIREKIELINFQNAFAHSWDGLAIEEFLISKASGLPKQEIKTQINTLLSIIGLSNRRNLKIGEISEGEKRRLIVAAAALKSPYILLLMEPERELNATEKKRIWDSIIAINDSFSMNTFIFSVHEELSRCHNILVLSNDGKQLGFGTLSQLMGELPIYKEVIVLQLKTPNQAHLDLLRNLENVSFIVEERTEEKYRIFTKIDPNKIIPIIFQQIGSNIYKISKEPPSLIDFIPYKQTLS